MAEIKDKVITVESLKTLQEYNNGAYVKKSGDTMTGALTSPYLNIKHASNNTPTLSFRDSVGGIHRAALSYDGNTNYRLYLSQYHPDQDNATTRYYDGYVLPPTTSGKTKSDWYTILTTKNPVTVAQGGTGSTNGATGLKNLFAAGATVLSSNQYGDELPAAGTKGRIFFKRLTDI